VATSPAADSATGNSAEQKHLQTATTALVPVRRFISLPIPREGMGMEESDIDPAQFLEDVEMRVGTVQSAADFPEARKDVYKLEVDFGEETRQSAAGLTDNYSKDDLEGRQVVAVVNLGTVNIAGFESQCLVVGVDDEDGDVVHLQPERPVPDGQRIY
jgi:tRNA-binding protein